MKSSGKGHLLEVRQEVLTYNKRPLVLMMITFSFHAVISMVILEPQQLLMVAYKKILVLMEEW